MKKWLRRTLIAALIVALTFGILYECATHVGRGWLRGEAFYNGRPTSYWRWRIDEWTANFAKPEDALDAIGPAEGPMMLGRLHKYNVRVHLRPPTLWDQVQAWVHPWHDQRGEFPEVLECWTDSEAVLQELDQDAGYRPFVRRVRANPWTW